MAKAKEDKEHLSIVICGHVDAGKSTTTGHLLFKLGGLDPRELEKLQKEADTLGKSSFAFAFFMDKQKDERARGVTISCTTKEFFTDSYHYTIIDAPGHRDFIKNMISGTSQADVALLMVPADGNFEVSLAKGDHKAGEVQGQTRQHARLVNLLGVKQLIVGVNKMDTQGYKEERYNEVANEVRSVLQKVGWKKEFVMNDVPVIPMSGFHGENLCDVSTKMTWWKGVEVNVGKEKVKVVTLLDCLEKMVKPPPRPNDGLLRVPVSGILNIKGVGDVVTGRIEQGTLTPGTEVVFAPTHSASNACGGKVFSMEMHHSKLDKAVAGDNIGINMKGLDKNNMPRVGDIMIAKNDATLGKVTEFTCQVQVLDHPGELKKGYTPVGFVRTGRSAIRMTKIVWKMGKETGGQKAEDPPFLKANEMGEVVFAPQHPMVVDTFKNCEGLGRIAIMEGNSVVMLGKITKIVLATEDSKGAKGKKK